MKDPFQTGKMPSVPLVDLANVADGANVTEGAPDKPSSQSPPSARASAYPLAPPSSDGNWKTGEHATERTTDPVLAVPTTVDKDRATLTVLSGINAGQVFALDGTDHVIGRGTEADVWVEDGGVSRRHARITCRSDGRYFVEDLGSTNGTFLGPQRVDLVEIRPGDRVQLGPSVVLRFAITDDAEEELQRRLYESSTRDPLTRVYNRKYFTERLTAEVAYSRRHRVKLAVLMLDLDDFKATNDTYGHLAGDMVLRLVSAQMQRLIRVEDLLARYGGEEFVILARSTGKTDAVRLAERIRETIRDLEIPLDGENVARTAPPIGLGPGIASGKTIKVSLSIGVAALPDVPEGGPIELLGLADARLYRAKAQGKDRVCSDGVG